MKKLLFCASLLLAAGFARAAHPVTVDHGTSTTVAGVGGYSEIAYAFAAGDKITITGHASKMLDRMLVTLRPETVLGRVKESRNISLTFTVPQEGIVVIRFVSDRGGSNKVNYDIVREPANDALQNYETKINWVKPTDHIGELEPVRVAPQK